MDFLPVFGTDELQRRPSGVRARLLPGAGGRWVNKVNGRHYAYLTLEKPEGFEVTRISCHQFATNIGEVAEQTSWGSTFELFDCRRGKAMFYVTLTPPNEVAEADRRARWTHLGRVREMRPLETTARPA